MSQSQSCMVWWGRNRIAMWHRFRRLHLQLLCETVPIFTGIFFIGKYKRVYSRPFLRTLRLWFGQDPVRLHRWQVSCPLWQDKHAVPVRNQNSNGYKNAFLEFYELIWLSGAPTRKILSLYQCTTSKPMLTIVHTGTYQFIQFMSWNNSLFSCWSHKIESFLHTFQLTLVAVAFL
jgi:hypothetical protein